MPLSPLDVATGVIKKVKKRVNETRLICCTNDEVIAHYQLTSGKGKGEGEGGKSVRESERANRYNVALTTKVATSRS